MNVLRGLLQLWAVFEVGWIAAVAYAVSRFGAGTAASIRFRKRMNS
jgi:hypothetical protein